MSFSIQLSENIDFFSSVIYCVIHAADGSIKRIEKSKAINVQEITNFCQPSGLFQLSWKSLATINEELKVVELKPVHFLSFYPTCTKYLLAA